MWFTSFVNDESFCVMLGVLFGHVLIDYWTWIFVAMSSRLVRILLLRRQKDSSGGLSKFLKTFQLTFLRLILHNWRYFEMAFLTHYFIIL